MLQVVSEPEPAHVQTTALHVDAVAETGRLNAQQRQLSGVPLIDELIAFDTAGLAVDGRDVREVFSDAVKVVLKGIGDHEGLALQLARQLFQNLDLLFVKVMRAAFVTVFQVSRCAHECSGIPRHGCGLEGA